MPRTGDVAEFLAIPRVNGLRLSPDGSWLAAPVQTMHPDGSKYVTSIWRIDPAGAAPVRLTWSAEGESAPEFLPDGSLLFISKRPGPPAADKNGTAEADRRPALWLLPAAGGDARLVASPPGGVGGVAAARAAGRFLLSAPVFPGAESAAQDAQRRKARKDAGVNAILHEGGLVRYWDHDLGPDCQRLLTAEPPGQHEAGPAEPRDLTPDAGRALDEQSSWLSPDGTLAVTGWWIYGADGEMRAEVAVIDVATGERRVLLSDPDANFHSPQVSPDGRLVLAVRDEHDTYQRPGEVTLVVAALDGSDGDQPRDLLPGWDRRPGDAAWAPDSASVFVCADDRGRCPVFRAALAGGEITPVTSDDAAYSSPCPAPDGTALYALRSAIDQPPAPVRISLSGPAGPVFLQSPAGTVETSSRVEEVAATASDGTGLRGWLVLPEGASRAAPAPLLLWVHGGPVSSWNAWSWRWNPLLAAARGYAVLLPDPALSTGYGHDFLVRGYGTWGDKPYTDVMDITDAVAARPDIDSGRTAMMGGSFGGYMANWIAGHTDRFAAIVSHAGLWALDQMFGTTDGPPFWRHEFGDPATMPERYEACSPHLHLDKIVTPMLIIHGDKDYRVPVGEALRLYWDLRGHGKEAKFLYFPDENHWILKPGDARVWYETVFAFLAEQVLGEKWQQPELL
ncbi:MAG TPA: S9 family peptidase [Streptosporangiaceae bacterium]|jgi:dipeptidyl aminopeptidase/acylaminoacyl peptidase